MNRKGYLRYALSFNAFCVIDIPRQHDIRHRILSAVVLAVLLLLVAATLPRKSQELRQSLPSVSSTFRMASIYPNCRRKPASSSAQTSLNQLYHEFDNVLLIVFFSHPRYDVNLDYYKEVYADYFPNVMSLFEL
jgi:hypothetical protein